MWVLCSLNPKSSKKSQFQTKSLFFFPEAPDLFLPNLSFSWLNQQILVIIHQLQVDPPLEIQEHQRETGCGSADGMEDHHVLSFLVSKTAETITLFWDDWIHMFWMIICIYIKSKSGWWFQPLWKIVVSWDDEIPNIWKNKTCSKPPTRYWYIYIYVYI